MKRVCVYIILISLLFSLGACQDNSSKATVREEDLRAVCELATLEVYFNNVAKYTKKADNIFQLDRKMWIEYQGVAYIGVDMSEVLISIKNDTVEITMPSAKLLSVNIVEDTLNKESYITSSDGWLVKNKITTQDQEKAIEKGQAAINESVLNNKALFIQAQDRAKELMENYIDKIGEVTDRNYKIVWKDLPASE